ncbi:NAD(P)-dependent oxidoreductase [Nocardioides sp. LMS-CY]|uniref:NAD(P)-dependent oxidoreductase n=1 Tax=Nocardioides sp. (strain LMS-CY) TaxID=2840457 RepID=UPI001C0008A9|nr:NAD(P)-dependent oxidoreductase [Nocardioides sp. LMS-CY]QWF20497.1 NAD(P)-dependent oxidoreductase [Nocardioides sp. LMS-CY]
MARVSFAGLGNMGHAMVGRLLDEGHVVTVWNRSPEAADDLVARGAVRAASVAELFDAGPVLSMLADDAAVASVFDDSVLAAAGPGSIHVSMSTISAQAGRALARRHANAGIALASVPVLGRPEVAAAGRLNLLAAGDSSLIDDLAPVLDSLGQRTWRVGEHPEQANVVKVTMNFLILHALQAMAEAFALAEQHGVDSHELQALITGTLFPGPVYEGYGKEMASHTYLPAGFRTTLGMKDLTLARQAADEVELTLPTAAALQQTFQLAIDRGLGDLDWASIAEVVRST